MISDRTTIIHSRNIIVSNLSKMAKGKFSMGFLCIKAKSIIEMKNNQNTKPYHHFNYQIVLFHRFLLCKFELHLLCFQLLTNFYRNSLT